MGQIHRGQHTSIGERARPVGRLREHGRQHTQGDRPGHVESVQYGERGVRAENTRDERGSSQDSDSPERCNNHYSSLYS